MGEGFGSPGFVTPRTSIGFRGPQAIGPAGDRLSAVQSAAARLAALLLLRGSAAGLFLIQHPYGGLVQDARIYVGRGVADADPAGVGQDLIFRDDAQTGFSLLRVVVDGLLSVASPSTASLVLALAGACLWMAACWTLLRRLASLCLGEEVADRASWAMAVAVAVFSSHYGAFEVFSYAEAVATPRVFAEAAALGGLAALLNGRRAASAGMLALAGALHPIMALSAVALAVVVVAGPCRRCWSIALVLAAGLGLAAALDLPIAGRLSTTMDADWVSTLRERSPYLFPTAWRLDDIAAAILHGAMLVVAGLFAPSRARQLLWGTVSVAAAGVAGALLLGDWICDVLVTQLQLWRALWLVAVLGNASFALSLLVLVRRGAIGRLAAAILLLGWCSELAPLNAILFSVGAVALAIVTRRRPETCVNPILLKVAVALAALAVATVVAVDAAAVCALIKSAVERDGTLSWSVLSAAGVQSLPLALAAVYLASRSGGPPVRLWLALAGSLALLAAAVALWDQRTSDRSGFESGAGVSDLRAFFAPTLGAVLWVDEVAESWFTLGRASYFNALQGAPGLFSRDVALTWASRGAVLRELGLARAQDLAPWTSTDRRSEDLPLTPASVRRFCADPRQPAGLIVPGDQADAIPSGLASMVWRPPFRTRRLLVDGDEIRWRRIDAFTAVRCR